MLSRVLVLLVVAALLGSVVADTIVSDNLGNLISLPLSGGNLTGGYTNLGGPTAKTSPFILSVFINDFNLTNPATGLPFGGPAHESFYMAPTFANATLISQTFTPAIVVNNVAVPSGAVVSGIFLGNASSPNTAIGTYTYTFIIPVGGFANVSISYNNSQNPIEQDRIFISIFNTMLITGDPQFVGLRGQSYQVHGIDGAVYNIITEADFQVNSRFVFLSEGTCPIVKGVRDTNCWSHPGSYLGEMSFQAVVDGKLHAALVTAGAANAGFANIQMDGKPLKIGQTVSFGSFSLTYINTHRVSITSENYSFDLSNSDMFINQAVHANVPVSSLASHGLLGQTHSSKVYANSVRYIEGDVDDYIIGDNNIYGTDFLFNLFRQ